MIWAGSTITVALLPHLDSLLVRLIFKKEILGRKCFNFHKVEKPRILMLIKPTASA